MVEATGRVDGIGPAESELKRGLDVLGGLAILLFFAPIGAVAILAIRLSRTGPILDREQTVGLRGRVFGRWRLARPTAGETLFDRVARRAGLIRLPCVLNVIAGEMSLIGPQPHSPQRGVHMRHARGEGRGQGQGQGQGQGDYAGRFEARPGVIWPRAESGEASLSADLDYVSGWTLSRDLTIAARYLVDGLLRETHHDV